MANGFPRVLPLLGPAAFAVLAASGAAADDCEGRVGARGIADRLDGPAATGVVLPDSAVAFSVTSGDVEWQSGNALLPGAAGHCGFSVTAALPEQRLRLDVGGTVDWRLERDDPLEPPDRSGRHFADLSAALTPADAPLQWSLDAAFVDEQDSAAETLRHHFGAATSISLWQGRVNARTDLALSLDEEADAAGTSMRFRLGGDIVRAGDLRLGGAATYEWTAAEFADAGTGVTADRAIAGAGLDAGWGPLGLWLRYRDGRDNTADDPDAMTRRWLGWSGGVGIELGALLDSDLAPDTVSIESRRERLSTVNLGAADPSAAPHARAWGLDLRLAWRHGGGETALTLWNGMHADYTGSAGAVRRVERGLRLSRSVEADRWSLSAEAGLARLDAPEGARTSLHAYRGGLTLGYRPDEDRALRATGAARIGHSPGAGRITLDDLSALLTYEIRY